MDGRNNSAVALSTKSWLSMPLGLRSLSLGARRFAFCFYSLPFCSLAFALCPRRLTRRFVYVVIVFFMAVLFGKDLACV